ncbi:nuclear transport factor 2 family protein [Parahaliea mediterranea]|uniref:nuclear transport factor 2 family protein n=1 Tax=Parahaliea mediterranea TaxID=651086 RepID=UPI000E2ECDE3|nr:nuclear transport factor 2 family protein [Parahaliea mediterranea]
MLSQQEMSDRWEIQDLVFHYAQIIDDKSFDDLRNIFTSDAHVDYSVFGGSVGDLETTIAYLKEAVAEGVFPNSQHLNANVQVSVDGDTGKGRVMCFNPMEMAMPDGGTQVFMLGLWYVDEYRRTDAGWRISRRVEEKSWVFNVPDFMGL